MLRDQGADEDDAGQRLIWIDCDGLLSELDCRPHVAAVEMEVRQLELGSARARGESRRLLENLESFLLPVLLDDRTTEHVERLEAIRSYLEGRSRGGLGLFEPLVGQKETRRHRVQVGVFRRALEGVLEPAVGCLL